MEQNNRATNPTAKSKPARKKWSLQKKISLCKQWHSSSLTKTAFAKQHGIHPHIFTQWTNRLSEKYVPKKLLPLEKETAPHENNDNPWVSVAVNPSTKQDISTSSQMVETTVLLQQGVSLTLHLTIYQLHELIRSLRDGISTES